MIRKHIGLYLLLVFIAACVFLSYIYSNNFHKNIVAMQVQDGRLLFGNLHGNTLCNYQQLDVRQDPKTKKQTTSLDKGGALYGGDGCVTFSEPILWTEPLSTSTRLYSQLSM